MEFNLKSSYIHLEFEKPILNKLRNITFSINKNIHYTNNSFFNYYYEIKQDDITISFNGFYKDEYFLIFIDIIDNELNNSVYYKDVIIIKLDWNLNKLNDELSVNEINIIKKKYKYFKLPIRQFLENNNDISIDDILSINRCIHYDVKIKKTNTLKTGILSYFI
tara:strand:+ start:38 stop:529 length:492 start_codon:yes stop_codon:yes gene_type:complete